ncbi:MAG: hypothetical protein MUC48_07460 [Leptolyngbya sp. Prado105]|jgi:hypothetical protein|nr:hypothetical protein [Leptolyngbya sp. Prado105]
MKRFLRVAYLSGLLLTIAPAVRAFEVTPVFDPSFMTAWTAGEHVRFDLEKRAAEAKRRGIPDRPTASNSQVSLAYVPTPAFRQQIVQGFVQRLSTKNSAASEVIATTFGSGKNDYAQVYHTITKDSGLRQNDAIDVMSAYMIMGYMIVNNVQDGRAITVPMAQGVRSQIAPMLTANPQLKNSKIAAQIGEELKLQSVILHAGWRSSVQENNLSNYRQGIAALFKNQYGIDMSRMKLTNQGFVLK